jgi:hypothetical protein
MSISASVSSPGRFIWVEYIMVIYGFQEFIVAHLVFLETQVVTGGSQYIVLVCVRPASGGTVGDDLLVFSPRAAAMRYDTNARRYYVHTISMRVYMQAATRADSFTEAIDATAFVSPSGCHMNPYLSQDCLVSWQTIPDHARYATWLLVLIAVTGLLSVSSMALGTLLAFISYRGPFSLLNLTISELGLSSVSPRAGVFNGSLIVGGGVCLALFTQGLGHLLRGWYGTLLMVLGGSTGLTVALVGVFSGRSVAASGGWSGLFSDGPAQQRPVHTSTVDGEVGIFAPLAGSAESSDGECHRDVYEYAAAAARWDGPDLCCT